MHVHFKVNNNPRTDSKTNPIPSYNIREPAQPTTPLPTWRLSSRFKDSQFLLHLRSDLVHQTLTLKPSLSVDLLAKPTPKLVIPLAKVIFSWVHISLPGTFTIRATIIYQHLSTMLLRESEKTYTKNVHRYPGSGPIEETFFSLVGGFWWLVIC